MNKKLDHFDVAVVTNLVIIFIAIVISSDLEDFRGVVLFVTIFLLIFDILVYLSYRINHKNTR